MHSSSSTSPLIQGLNNEQAAAVTLPQAHALSTGAGVRVTHYTPDSELFVEYPPLVAGQASEFVAHLTWLKDEKRPKKDEGTDKSRFALYSDTGAGFIDAFALSARLADLLIAMPGDPAIAACTLVASSGVEVPKPTIVSPASRGEMPSRAAMPTAPRTNSSPPSASSTSPPATSSRDSVIRRPF